MISLKKTIYLTVLAALSAAASVMMPSCNKNQSFSDLLREEERATNAFLATQRVSNEIPADSISFELGPDAPFYKLDEDGYIYMQVIKAGDPKDKPAVGDPVYFRFDRENLKYTYNGYDKVTVGNQNDFANATDMSTRFIFGGSALTSSSQWGTGIQWPLRFFGYDTEVNLVLRSYYGFLEDQTSCQPYLINIKYYKPEY